ncbi:hypothetical protein KKE06_02350 [Candidatus Micrarchaeota archaeon]|nr:hypothetical protein [Candidatus Micrarchaeota archaeon]MBU1930095.1 hypothetical protein [Candidatus Micrarchaeota archaeon]
MKKYWSVLLLLVFFSVWVSAQTITTDQNRYEKGDLIIITGQGETDQTVTIQAHNEGRFVFEETTTIDGNGSFLLEFESRFLDPSGEWVLLWVEADKRVFITMEPSAFSSRYVVTFLSPVPGTFERATTIPITVRVEQAGKIKPRALVVFWTPTGEKKFLKHAGFGNFTGEFTVPFDQSLGQWELVVTAEDRSSAEEVFGGENRIQLEFSLAPLIIELVEPLPARVSQGETVFLPFSVHYLNEQALQNPTVTAELNGVPLTIQSNVDGFFSTQFTAPGMGGEINLLFRAVDSAQNGGEKRYSIIVTGLWDSFWEKNLLLVFLGIIILIVILVFGVWKWNKHQQKRALTTRKQVLVEQLKKLQIQYFKEQSIDRKTFEEKSALIENEMASLKKKGNKSRSKE